MTAISRDVCGLGFLAGIVLFIIHPESLDARRLSVALLVAGFVGLLLFDWQLWLEEREHDE